MANKDLFKQAIADAKSIREAAIANAKLALEESLTPQLKELLAQRLAEMEEEEAPAAVISEEETTVEELVAEEATEEVEEETLEEATVDSAGLLAVEEAEGEEEEGEEEAGEEGEAEGEEAGEEAEDDSEESEDEAGEEEEVGEMSVDELKDLIRDVLMQVMGDQEEAQEDELEAGAEDMEGEDMTAADDTISVDEEINIDELMAELAQIKDPAAAPAPTDHGNLEEAEEQIDELAEAAVNEIVAGLKGEAKEYITKMAEARGCSMQELMKEMARYGTVSEMKSVAEMLNSMSKLGEVAFMEVAGKLIAEKAAPAPAMEVAEGELNEVDPVTGAIAMASTIGAIVSYFAADQAAGKKEQLIQGIKSKIEAGEALSPEESVIIKKFEAKMAQDPTFFGKMGQKLQGVVKGLQSLANTMGTRTGVSRDEAQTEELNEALTTIETLRNELNETNLLNAKLLYVNKVFKANNLTESQKANVIAAFDKAETVKEVKLVFETVSENVASAGKKEVVKEAKGFASAATGNSTKPEVIAEADQAVLRMQKLAGIIK